MQQDKVDVTLGIISTGVGLALGPVVEEARALTIFWDGTTQDGVEEKLPNARYLFKSTDNECEAVMSSLVAIKHWKGQFKRVAGINPDYSYGRNNMAAFVALLKRFNIEHEVVTEQWPKLGVLDLTSHVAALKAAKPDLIFSSLLFAELPIFMKQAHAAELTKGTKLVFPAAGLQHTLMKKDFTPEGTMLLGHNTLYFDNPKATPLQKEFVAWYDKKYNDYPSWVADRAYFTIASYKAAVEKAAKAKNVAWPAQDDIIDAMEGLSVESLGGKGSWRKDHIADQTFIQGLTTHKNKYDFVTLDPAKIETMYSTDLQKPAGRQLLGVAEDRAVQDLTRRQRIPCRRSATSCSAAFSMPPCCFWSRPDCSSCSACRRSSIWRAARSMRWAPTSASRSSTLALNAGLPPWMLLPMLLVAGAADGGGRPADRAAAAHGLRPR